MSDLRSGTWLHGLDAADSARKAELFARATSTLPAGDPIAPVRHLYVPGRIEVFGKHTDYGGGATLVCAPSRGFCAAFRPRLDPVVQVVDSATGQIARFEIDAALQTDLKGWPRYPATVVRRLATNFPGRVRGVDLAFDSDLPQAAGMSSSSALMVTVLLALVEAGDLPSDSGWAGAIRDRVDLAAYAGCVENGSHFGPFRGDAGVGTSGGSEDHMAMLCGEASRLSLCHFVPPRLDRTVPLASDVTFAIGVSGVVAEKTGAARDAYNAASRRARRLLELWQQDTGAATPSLEAVLSGGPSAAAHLRALALEADRLGGERLTARLDQFALESRRLVPDAAAAFERGDWDAVGELAAASHRAADEWLGNQVAETNALVEQARAAGALAASAFGAGFGGSAWALVPRAEGERIVQGWGERYRAACPNVAAHASFFLVDAGPHAQVR